MNQNYKQEKNRVRKLLIRAEKARKKILQPYFSQIGLTLGQGQFRILDTLMTQDHITQKELADLCHMDVTTMSRNLDKLEQSGFLIRERNPDSRRSFLICLTEKGAEEAKKVQKVMELVDGVIMDGMSCEELPVFLRCLERICENLEQCQM